VQWLFESLGQHTWAWLAVAGLGAYHGLNPAMGWLFAVSNAMQSRQGKGVFLALPPIACGHFLAMAAALLPFALVALYVDRLGDIRVAAGVILLSFGLYRLVSQRHPRFLARVGPSHLVLWSFLMATAHGAGLMLVPVVLGLCESGPVGQGGHEAWREVASGGLGLTVVAATAHTIAMMVTGGVIAWVVYRYVGLALLRRSWLNVDLIWAALLVVTGATVLVAG
jgi:hypothetical protein